MTLGGSLFAAVFVAALTLPLPAMATEPVITGIAARPFSPDTGLLDADALAADAPPIVNHLFGQTPVSAFLIVVSIEGPPNLALNGKVNADMVRALHLEILEGTPQPRPILSVSKPLTSILSNGRLEVPFLIDSTGCQPLRLRASLVGGGGRPVVREQQLTRVCQD